MHTQIKVFIINAFDFVQSFFGMILFWNEIKTACHDTSIQLGSSITN